MLKCFITALFCSIFIVHSVSAKHVMGLNDRFERYTTIANESRLEQIYNLKLPFSTTREELDTIILNQVLAEAALGRYRLNREQRVRYTLWKHVGALCGLKITQTQAESADCITNLQKTNIGLASRVNSFMIMEMMLALAKETGKPVSTFYHLDFFELDALIDAL